MFRVRLAAVFLAALVLAPAAQAHPWATPKPPYDLRAFLLRPGDLTQRDFSRTPAFAWYPVRGADHYEFELSTSKRFSDSEILWSSDEVKAPAVSIPIALPWKTGSPYAFYARVRAITPSTETAWAEPFGFNMRWADAPTDCAALDSSTPGCPKINGAMTTPALIRWSLVEGATSYHVWFLDADKVIATKTNVADEREFFSFHQFAPWMTTVRWRVRAVRSVYGTIANGTPAVSYGPWSKTFVSTNPTFTGGPLSLGSTVSNVVTASGATKPHELTPAFTFSGNQSLAGTAAELYRVYVATDSDCVNIVFKGAISGSPAYAPRMTGPLALPSSDPAAIGSARTLYLRDSSKGEGFTYMADGAQVVTSESDGPVVAPEDDPTPSAPSSGESSGDSSDSGSSGSSSSGSSDSSSSGASGSSSTSPTTVVPGSPTVPATPELTQAPVDLWDSGWPSGHYYWTVVPVGGTIDGTWRDLELPQDACAAGRVMKFGKESEPVVSASGTPYVAGLSPRGLLTTASSSKPVFYGSPLVTWQPALGADEYQVQWSKKSYPWKSVAQLNSFTTSAALPLTPGTWFYRVRGINYLLPGSGRAMSWSNPVQVRIAKPTFTVVKS